MGPAASAGFPQQIEYADARVVRATLGSFVSNFPSVTPDTVVQKQYIDRTYALLRTSDPATERINAWFRGNSPFDRALSTTVAVEITNILPLSNQTYQVDWTEFQRDRQGKELVTRRYHGIATVTLTPPQDEAVIRFNPIGDDLTAQRAGGRHASIAMAKEPISSFHPRFPVQTPRCCSSYPTVRTASSTIA